MKKDNKKRKEIKRYSIVEYAGKQYRKVSTIEEYQELLKIIRTINSKKSHENFYGNVTLKEYEGGYIATICCYRKLSIKRTLKDIDDETIKYDNIADMIEKGKDYKSKIRMGKPDLYIIYFDDKSEKEKNKLPLEDRIDIRIKPLELYFKKDKKFLDETFQKMCLADAAKHNELNIFLEIYNQFRYYNKAGRELDEFQKDISLFPRGLCSSLKLSTDVINIYKIVSAYKLDNGKAETLENGQIRRNYRILRDLANILRNRNAFRRITAMHSNIYNEKSFEEKNLTEKDLMVKKLR